MHDQICFFCEDCQEVLEIRHFIKEKPGAECLTCHNAMVRDITGGSHQLVKGGKATIHQGRAQDAKDRADMKHAGKVANYIKSHAQPKTQSAFMKKDSIKGETQPAAPGERVKK